MRCKNYERAFVRFYNAVAGVRVDRLEEIPPGALTWLQGLSYEELVKPDVVQQLRGGWGRDTLAKHYCIPARLVREWGEDLGRYKPEKKRHGPPAGLVTVG